MNGNDYLEIEEEQAQRIQEDYIEAIKKDREQIPSKFIIEWIDSYLQG